MQRHFVQTEISAAICLSEPPAIVAVRPFGPDFSCRATRGAWRCGAGPHPHRRARGRPPLSPIRRAALGSPARGVGASGAARFPYSSGPPGGRLSAARSTVCEELRSRCAPVETRVSKQEHCARRSHLLVRCPAPSSPTRCAQIEPLRCNLARASSPDSRLEREARTTSPLRAGAPQDVRRGRARAAGDLARLSSRRRFRGS